MQNTQGHMPAIHDVEIQGARQCKLIIAPTRVTIIRDGQRHDIPLLRIAGVEIIRPGPLGTGKLRLLVPGSGTHAALVGDFEAHDIAFGKRQLDAFLHAQTLIEQYQAKLHRSSAPYTSAAHDETGHLASL